MPDFLSVGKTILGMMFVFEGNPCEACKARAFSVWEKMMIDTLIVRLRAMLLRKRCPFELGDLGLFRHVSV